ncbi:developmental pluripotency-associated protein 2 [Apodemus sylvaticus]|uniref:developmental pluripotency-associated protein 2 n=1 Tax=Apodemus sylvaticus TaxID=10129 RepID=UPI002242EE33|nr:developmental pluripotency-associated protein 2 [Apodemus sylvaticus]
MSYFDLENYYKGQSEEDLEEESVVLTLVPFTEEPTTEYLPESNVSSSISHKPPARSVVRHEGIKQPRAVSRTRTIPGTCPPPILPPISNVSRDTLREWCRYYNLSTDGQKVEVYLRLQRHSYSKQECYIPHTSREAKMKSGPRKPKIVFRGIGPPNSCHSRKQESGILEILTSPKGSTFAAWGKIAMRAARSPSKNRCPLPSNAEAFLPQTTGLRWCIVHGRQLPADKKGWVRLQFCAGQTWVPDSSQRMNFLFLLPACIIPEPGVEDNLLCPDCVHSNKKMMRKFETRSHSKKKALSTNMPS